MKELWYVLSMTFFILSRTCNKFLIIDREKCTPFNDSLDIYPEILLSGNGFQHSKYINVTNIKKINVWKRNFFFWNKILNPWNLKKQLWKKLSRSCDEETYDLYKKCCNELSSLKNSWLELNI
jgi:hypothetical protein